MTEEYSIVYISSLQLLSHVWLFATPWIAARQASLSISNSQSLLKPMSIELVMPSNHLILCCPLLLPSIFPSTRVFPNESALRIRWPKYWSFSFSISPSNEYSGLISSRIDWFDFLAIQGTLKSLLQHHSSKSSILQHLGFFIAQSHEQSHTHCYIHMHNIYTHILYIHIHTIYTYKCTHMYIYIYIYTYIYISHLLYPFICWTFRLLLCLGYCK